MCADIKLGYCRVSSKDQLEGRSLGDQEAALLREGVLPEHLFRESESAYRNKQRRRKEFQGFLDEGKRLEVLGHRVQLITVYGDRWARDTIKLIGTIEDLESHGIICRALDYGRLSVSSSDDRLKLTIFAGIYQGYSDKLSERVSASVAERIAKGIPIGNPPLGYAWNDNKSGFLPDKRKRPDWKGASAWEVARFAVDVMLDGKCSSYSVSRAVENRYTYYWDPGSLSRWLKNETLLGAVCYRKLGKFIWNQHEPLINFSEHEALKAQLARNVGRVNKKAMGTSCRLYAISSGDCRCAWCGEKLGGTRSGNYRYFACRRCDDWQGNARDDEVEAAVVQALTERAEELAAEVFEPEEGVSPRLAEFLDKKKALEALLQSFDSPGVRADLQAVELEIRSIQSQGQAAQAGELDKRELAQLMADPSVWGEFSELERRIFYRDLLDCVVCRGREIVRVKLKF